MTNLVGNCNVSFYNVSNKIVRFQNDKGFVKDHFNVNNSFHKCKI